MSYILSGHYPIDGARNIPSWISALANRAHIHGRSTDYTYLRHKHPSFPPTTNRTTTAVNRDGDVQDQAGGYAGRAHRDQCDGPIVMRSAQQHNALIVSVRGCYLDVHSRRRDNGGGPYGERVGVALSLASNNYLQAMSIVLFGQCFFQSQDRFSFEFVQGERPRAYPTRTYAAYKISLDVVNLV